ncbi:MAG: dCTP deaminase [Candidatus Melainabacteria bacterium]|jgi:dCTP deaminase
MIKNDKWIRDKSQSANLIEPFENELVNELENGHKALSYGLSSYGYDIRLSEKEFWVFRHIPGTVVDPKNFNPKNLEQAELLTDEKTGDRYFVLPAHSYGLGVAIEKLNMPENASCIAIGKSTYARCGIIANTTPAEAGWIGHLTLEFSNSSGADCRIYAGEGVVQLIFFEGEPCETSYAKRAGKYQSQSEKVTIAKV